MKEDVLEQLVDDYLKLKGYFTIHNVRFQPDSSHPDFNVRQDCVSSDIDVIGYHPNASGPSRVYVVSCKSWQGGFDAGWWGRHVMTNKKVAGREAWKFFRELVKPKWNEAFFNVIHELAGQRQFNYVTAVTRVVGDSDSWEQHPQLRRALCNNPIQLLPLSRILNSIENMLTETPAASDIGRLVQLMKAANRT